jgi:methyl-accepting chemotaxis protein
MDGIPVGWKGQNQRPTESDRIVLASRSQLVVPAMPPGKGRSMNLAEAIKKHTDWKIKLRSAITNHETVDAATISRDNACEFGKWLHGDGRAAYGHRPGFANCVSAHAAFHLEAGKVAAAINAKKYDEAKAMLAIGTQFAGLTGTVSAAIANLQKEAA